MGRRFQVSLPTVSRLCTTWINFMYLQIELICARGRTLRELEDEGVGSNVYLQRETEALSRLVSAPRYDDDLRNSLWVREACYPGMDLTWGGGTKPPRRMFQLPPANCSEARWPQRPFLLRRGLRAFSLRA
ncbi:hypothetical protein HPB52_022936 [Rhipicephalus sanguineus]|uniref:Uncharacterized protein n=1 Tax=Rhipicephalus sanguineus TaxID=34632 RepID=A0A9D4PQM1_RHISA|nr:hypothetical protein HPB52_022936 [Rhipicephalus sanguineus]